MSTETLQEDASELQAWKQKFRLVDLVSEVNDANKNIGGSDFIRLYKVVRRRKIGQEIIAAGGGERKFIQLFCRACRRTDIFQNFSSTDDGENDCAAKCSQGAKTMKLLVGNRALLQQVTDYYTPSLDVAILLDMTKDCIKPRALARNLFSIIISVLQQWSPLRLRIAAVGYRDFDCEASDRLVVLPFDSHVWPLRKWLQEASGFGGADSADDVLGGMAELAKLDWTADCRVAIHIGNSPCHGTDYHSPECSDDYPAGDPTGLDPATVLQSLKDLSINYAFLRTNWRTDIMVKKFNEITEHYLDSLPLKMQSLSTTVSNILLSSLNEQDLANRLADADLEDEAVDNSKGYVEPEDDLTGTEWSDLFSDMQIDATDLWS